MSDTKELRRLAQAASHPTTKGRWIRLFGERTVYDRTEDGCRGIPVVSTDKHPPSPFEAACLDFIAAANPAAVIGLLDRLEESESDALEQARLNGMGSEREAALMAKLEAAEKDIALKERVIDSLGSELNAVANERDALRAKVEAMEQQEPVYLFRRKGWEEFCTCSKERYEEFYTNPRVFEVKKLYLAPGAKGEIK